MLCQTTHFFFSLLWQVASRFICALLTLAGHGGQTKDLDGDEEDGYDEVIYLVDFRQVGHIVDDEMHRILVQPLQAGVRLTVIFDSCHSGTALDLHTFTLHKVFSRNLISLKKQGQAFLMLSHRIAKAISAVLLETL